MTKEFIMADNVLKARGYSHAVKVGNTIYVAGCVALDEEGNVVGQDDFAAQAGQAFENMKRVLEAAGASIKDVVMMTQYCKDISRLGEIREPWRKYFSYPYPAVTAVEVSRLFLPEILLEVDAVAVVE